MILHGFRSVMWLGAVSAAAISCYMVSLRVAAERASLEKVETRILVAKRDIRALDTELTTRGRVRQLERWNEDVLALTAPREGQFLGGEVQLASLGSPAPRLPDAGGDANPMLARASAKTGRQNEAKLIHAEYRHNEPADDPADGAPPVRTRAAAPAPKAKPHAKHDDIRLARPVVRKAPATKVAKAEAKPRSSEPSREAKAARPEKQAAATKPRPKPPVKVAANNKVKASRRP